MKTPIKAGMIAMGLQTAGGALYAQDCGTVSLALHNTPSATLLAYVDKAILEMGFGCSVDLIPGDTVPSTTSLIEKGNPQVSPETYINLMRDIIDTAKDEDKIVTGAKVLSEGGVQAWFMPKFIQDANPEIRTVEDALARPDLFPHPEDNSKGVVFNGAEGWGGTIVTTNLFKAYDAEAKGFAMLHPGSAAGLDGAIARAFERQTGFISYYWAPTALLQRYEMVVLEGNAPYDAEEWTTCTSKADCADPKITSWPVDEVWTLYSKDFAETAPATVIDYFNTRAWDNATVGAGIRWQDENQAMGEDAALYFLEEFKPVWTTWVPAEIAAKIEAEL